MGIAGDPVGEEGLGQGRDPFLTGLQDVGEEAVGVARGRAIELEGREPVEDDDLGLEHRVQPLEAAVAADEVVPLGAVAVVDLGQEALVGDEGVLVGGQPANRQTSRIDGGREPLGHGGTDVDRVADEATRERRPVRLLEQGLGPGDDLGVIRTSSSG